MPAAYSRVSALAAATSVNFDPSTLENFHVPSVDPLPSSDMKLSQSLFKIGVWRCGLRETSVLIAAGMLIVTC